jgi:predicted nuclease with RNAse H fold
MMRTLGIDLAAEPPGTAACEITWTSGSAQGRVHTAYLDDAELLRLIASADKVGIDCPFGWPQPFVEAVSAHALGAPWPDRGRLGASSRRALRYRLTDEVVHKRARVLPLSVSSDRIGVTAMRCAGLLDALAAAGNPVDRDGRGRVAEVYPAAALRQWGLAQHGYKGSTAPAQARQARAQALDQLRAALPTLAIDDSTVERCRDSHDAFDALVCALIARAAALGFTLLPAPGAETERAHIEGWIHLPNSDLSRLQGT